MREGEGYQLGFVQRLRQIVGFFSHGKDLCRKEVVAVSKRTPPPVIF